MKTKHTVGPWTVNEATGEVIGVREGCSHPIICTTSAWWPGQEPGKHASQDVQWANARLIAAAPELLDALKAIVAITDGSQPKDYAGALMVAKSAIEKAQGGGR